MYYFCYQGANGMEYNHQRCNEGLLFDKVKLYCDWEYNDVQCDVKEAAEAEKGLSPRFTCPGEGFFPDGK